MASAREKALIMKYRYDAFLSYSHESDRALATALARNLATFAKPWYRLRSISVFRDEASLPVTPALWPTIAASLDDAAFLIVLASRASAESPWVDKEICYWITRATCTEPAKLHESQIDQDRVERVMLLLTDGELAWNNEADDFDWSKTTAVSKSFRKIFSAMPLWLDLRSLLTPDSRSIDSTNTDYITSLAKILSPIRRQSVETLLATNDREHRKTIVLFRSLSVSLAFVAGLSLWLAWVAIQSRNIAQANERRARHNLASSNLLSAERSRSEGHTAESLHQLLAVIEQIPPEDPLLYSTRCLLAETARGLVVTLPHHRPVIDAFFSPDGTRVVTIADSAARVWTRAVRYREPLVLKHETKLTCGAFSPDSTRIATASDDGVLRLWRADSGKQIASFIAHKGRIACLNFSPDGSRLVTASEDKTAHIWDVATGLQIGQPLVHSDKVRYASFSPNGQQLVTACYDKAARLWDLRTRKQIGSNLSHDHNNGGIVVYAAFSPNGAWIATSGGDNTAKLWNAQDQSLKASLPHESLVHSAVFSSDCRYVVTASADNTAKIWELETAKQIGLTLRHQDDVFSASFSPDGQRVLTASRDHIAQLWDSKTGVPVGAPLRHADEVYAAVFSSDGRSIITAGEDHIARIWNNEIGLPAGILRHEADVMNAAFSLDGRLIVTASYDKTAQIWDAKTYAPIGTPLKHKNWVRQALFSPSGDRIVTATTRSLPKESTMTLWDAASFTQIGTPVDVQAETVELTYAAEGKKLFSTSGDFVGRNFTLGEWDADLMTAIRASHGYQGQPDRVRFSPDRKSLISTDYDANIARVWSTGSHELLGSTSPHDGVINDVGFTHDGSKLITASGDRSVRMHDAKTYAEIGEPIQLEFPVSWAAFTPDDRRIITVSFDDAARCWDCETRRQLSEVMPHPAPILGLGMSPDGSCILTCGGDKSARVWKLSPPAAHDIRPEGVLKRSRLRLSVEVRTASTYDPKTGKMKVLSVDEWGRSAAALESMGGACDFREWEALTDEEKRELRTGH
jgi:WD40 repeat protein